MRKYFEEGLLPDNKGLCGDVILSEKIQQFIASDIGRKYQLPGFLFGLLNTVEEIIRQAVCLEASFIDVPTTIAKLTPEEYNRFVTVLFAATDHRQLWKVKNAFDQFMVKRTSNA